MRLGSLILAIILAVAGYVFYKSKRDGVSFADAWNSLFSKSPDPLPPPAPEPVKPVPAAIQKLNTPTPKPAILPKPKQSTPAKAPAKPLNWWESAPAKPTTNATKKAKNWWE